MNALVDTPFEACFLEGVRGRLFGLYFPAIGKTEGKLLCIPPFAEESNRCRVMLGQAARALAQAGWATLILDPYGCGDSEGAFEQADWSGWQADIDTGIEWLGELPGALGLWGTRLAALQVMQAAQRHRESVARVLLWQPVINGKQMFTQYLRLRVASSLEAFGRQESTKELRERLEQGETLEIGGYYITPTLAAAIDHAGLPEPSALSGLRVDWLERVDEGKNQLGMGSRKCIDAWQKAGLDTRPVAFNGPPFWQLHERFLAPELVDKTLAALTQDARPDA